MSTRRRPIGAAVLAGLVGIGLVGCDEGLPAIELKLSKNCNEIEVVTLAPRVAEGPGERVLDVAADSGTGERAWILVRRPDPAGGDDQLLVQQVDADGVVREIPLGIPIEAAPGLSLHPDPASDRVWVVREQLGLFEVTRLAPDDPTRPVLDSDNLVGFPSGDELCSPCDTSSWSRQLLFLPSGPILVSVPPFSVDAALIVWVTLLDTEGSIIRFTPEHQLNFEPPCEDDDTPEAQSLCEQEKMNLLYPEITVLGVQQDPRQDQSALFGHRVRRQSYDGETFPIDSADVFMITVSLDDNGVPAGVLRSYSGHYFGGAEGEFSATPSAAPPSGLAIDRFASYGLFSNGGVVPRLVQLPNSDPDFNELTDRISLTLDTRLLQLDRDLAMGQLRDGRWELTKLFPDDPVQSRTLVYEADAPITQTRSGGIGTFLLDKDGTPPEVVRLRCPAPEVTEIE